ncbi:type II toxin-antitoxin system VapB family antitoxin [Tianweitania populi]|uniref:Antitoxin VapB11 n=1 Tax=Tianweitania populi TaxID=1607949 RepID=A0A8J3GLL0_9HYPH|nr:type II toxin-antitoxin system VapB family antitoxin [Tianweitania populi]GHD18167.1 antitoxin VapB11 [Tianweitania populi]
MRTNIDIDDALMAEAMKAGGFPTKKAAVETALREWVLDAKRRKALDDLWGAVPDWEGDLDAMRRGANPEHGFHEDGDQ